MLDTYLLNFFLGIFLFFFENFRVLMLGYRYDFCTFFYIYLAIAININNIAAFKKFIITFLKTSIITERV